MASQTRPFPSSDAGGRRRIGRAAEMAVLFLAVPAALAPIVHVVRPLLLIPVSGLLAVAALAAMPAGSVRELAQAPGAKGWAGVLLAAAGAVTLIWLVAQAVPGPRVPARPEQRQVAFLVYPMLSALPQEVLFRSFFFSRYEPLFTAKWRAVAFNACSFALAHAYYGHAGTLVIAAAGGTLFATAYLRYRSLLVVALLHSICGIAILDSGLSYLFFTQFAAG